ncbi:4754_t:CDS:2 [Diversispora eburnea]|uniref:4754_t:CDS:1 n=1 Tax=Diversispora eburnea TaxID=1213867 RepID=A0A9N9ARQ6_9GLOM|nr:4754_t:CDS:2 [Diversispora eburnea]
MVYQDRLPYSPYRSLYQRPAYLNWLPFRISSFSRLIKNFIMLLLIISFISITFLRFKEHTHHDLIDSKNIPIFNNYSVMVFIVDGEQQANNLQPIFCQISKSDVIFTHVITTGGKHGMSGSTLKQKCDQISDCQIIIHDLNISKNYDIFIKVFTELIQLLNHLKPDVLLYIKDTNNEALSGIENAVNSFKKIMDFTDIAIPIDDVNHLMWLTDLPIEALKQWNLPKFQLQVVTQDRPDSLARLIRSLKSSHYFGDEITLTINMDRGVDPVTMEYCKTLEWKFGQKKLRHRIVQGGLMAAVVESYYPTDNNDYAILLEDDVELSPFFYIWTKYSILKYKYGIERVLSKRLFGISFYGTKINELHLPGRRAFDPKLSLEGTSFPLNSPYLCQVPCSWGAVYFPEIWKEFHYYFPARLQDWKGLRLQNITIPDVRSNNWKNSWKRFFIELAYIRGYVMLYPNYDNFISLSTNHAEAGTHIHLVEGKPAPNDIFGVPLMEENDVLSGLPDGKLPNYINLPMLDLLGNIVSAEEIVQRGRILHSEISLCPPSENDEISYDSRDLLCVDAEAMQLAIEAKAEIKRKNDKLMTALKLISIEFNDTETISSKLFDMAIEINNNERENIRTVKEVRTLT